MPISAQCPKCASPVTAPDAAAGKKVQCWSCKTVFGLFVPPPEPEVELTVVEQIPEVLFDSPEAPMLRLSCFVCFDEIVIPVQAGLTSVACPGCASVNQVGELMEQATPKARTGFEGFEEIIDEMNKERVREIKEGDRTAKMLFGIATNGFQAMG